VQATVRQKSQQARTCLARAQSRVCLGDERTPICKLSPAMVVCDTNYEKYSQALGLQFSMYCWTFYVISAGSKHSNYWERFRHSNSWGRSMYSECLSVFLHLLGTELTATRATKATASKADAVTIARPAPTPFLPTFPPCIFFTQKTCHFLFLYFLSKRQLLRWCSTAP
jgi:hypothetical protein